MPKKDSFLKTLSLVPLSIRHKLMIGFALMSVIPILICSYIVSVYIFPITRDIRHVSIFMLLSIMTALLGLYITKEIVRAVIQLSRDADALASGDFSKIINQPADDEIGALSSSIRQLVEHIQLTSIKDKLTGLYNKNYLSEKLNDDIKIAISMQIPCACVFLQLSRYEDIRVKMDEQEFELLIKKIADIFKKSIPHNGKVIRIEENQFALILPECNKQTAYSYAGNISNLIGESGLAIYGGVSEVPIDGVDAKDLINKAKVLMEQAKVQGENKILI
ncbi:MAG: diguanylate cyclase [Candidatus Omnitrophota bacterium]